MNVKSKGPVFALCPVSVLATANPRTRAGLSPEYDAPAGYATAPLPPPPPCIMKSPFQASFSGRVIANPIPNSSPPAPLRRWIMPSTRQCAGNGPMGGAPGYSDGTVVPAGMSSALVISTPSILRLARPAQEFAGCAFETATAKQNPTTRSKDFDFIMTTPSFYRAA